MESLSEEIQVHLVEHLREYLEDLQDESHWESQCKRTQQNLMDAARRAKQTIAEGLAKPMDYDQL